MNSKNIVFKFLSSTGEAVTFSSQEGARNWVKVPPRTNVEILDPDTGHAPHKVVVKRTGNNLTVFVSRSKEGPSVETTLEGYYESEHKLIG